MSTFPERLRAERERLGIKQVPFAEIGGAKKHSQINYESGKTFPDAAYLMRVAEIGVDIQYLLTGIRAEVGSVADTARQIRERFSRHLVASASEAPPHVAIPWHELFQLAASAPIALASDWIAAQGLSASALRAAPIERAVMQVELAGTMLAIVDTSAPRAGGPAPWAAIIDEKTMLAEIEFHARSMVMPRLMTNGKSVTLWDDERQAVELLGRVVWLGVAPDDAP